MSDRGLGSAALALGAALFGLLVPACTRQNGPDRIAISVPYETETLDPHTRNTLNNFAIAFHFYEALVTTDAEMRIRPALAQLWENPDPSTWLFRLRSGVRFHSGRPLGAADVVWSIRRLLADDRLEVSGYVQYIADVSEVGPLTVRIRTTQPLSVLLNKLRFVAIVPEGSSADALALSPDGSGPYRLVEWVPRRQIRMARNDEYWGSRPALREVTFDLDRNPSQAADDFVAGRCQLVQCNSKSALQRLGRVQAALVQRQPSFLLKYLGYDLARDVTPDCAVRPNPFRNPLVREALDIAIDRARLAHDLSTGAVPAYQLVPPTIFGFNPGIAPSPHDPERARALLREAGLPNGFAATLHVRKMFAEAALLVRDQLALVGIRLAVTALGDDEFLSRARRREFSLYLSRIGAGTGDASDILDTGLHSIDPVRHMGVSNMGGYHNPEVDRLIEESAGIDSVAKRREAMERIASLVMRDRAWIPLYLDEDVYALQRTFTWRPRNDGFILAAEITPAGER